MVYRKATRKLIDWNLRTHYDPELVKASRIKDPYHITVEGFPKIQTDLILNEQSVRFEFGEILWLLAASGAMALSLRGSAKSYWGNRIEKAFLRTALTLLGLKQDVDFWLDVQGDEEGALWRQVDKVRTSEDDRRENHIPIEYGLIGEGNPEISADKMGRVGQRGGIVIVDKLREESRAYRNAVQEGAKVIVLRDNPHVLEELYTALNGRCFKPLSSPPDSLQEIEQAVRNLPVNFFV